MEVKSSRWQKPVADVGGITDLIASRVKYLWPCADQKDYRMNIVVHAYREVGTSLEAVVEVQIPKGPFGYFLKMGTIVL